MKKALSLIIIGLLGFSLFSMSTPWTAKAQEIVWSTNPIPLPTPTSEHTSIVHNGKIYVIGGRIGGGVGVPNVYFADINSDGTVGSWSETTPLPEWRSGATAVVWNNFVYVIAGSGPIYEGRPQQDTVFYAPINSNGTIGDWTLDPNRVPEKLVSHVAVVWNGRIYVIGGFNAFSSQDEIYYAEIDSTDGSLGNWNENPIPLPFPWESMCALVHDGVISLIGGWYGPFGPPHDKVSCAPIDETDGTVGPWDEKTPLPEPRSFPRCALINDDIYVVGGFSWDESPLQAEKTVYSTKFCIENWTEVQHIPEERMGHSVVTFHGRIYVLGGDDWDGEYIEKDTIYYSSAPTVARTLSVDAEGAHDYLPWENVKVKVWALVADVNTMEPVSDANVTITIYDPEDNLWINDTMTEKLNHGIYLWQSNQTVRQIFRHHEKGVYLVHVEASYGDGPTTSDILTFHIDPPPEEDNQLPIIIGTTITSIAILALAILYIIKKQSP